MYMNLIFLEETDSTNTYLKQLCRDGAEHETVVYTYNQLSGYGRHGKYWHSEKDKSLAMSLLLQPSSICSLPPISIAMGVAVHNVICKITSVRIKWPNDILANFRKICGISCECMFVDGRAHIILGIGINVNNVSFPGDLAQTATSLKMETGQEWDVCALMHEISKSVFEYYEMILCGEYPRILKEFKSNCINVGNEVTAFSKNKKIQGIAVDIDEMGCLIVQTKNGDCEILSAGEVSLNFLSGE